MKHRYCDYPGCTLPAVGDIDGGKFCADHLQQKAQDIIRDVTVDEKDERRRLWRRKHDDNAHQRVEQ